jgi:membrane protein required for colicin V production
MTWVDGVVLAILLLSAGVAYFRGAVSEVLSVGAWVGAAIVGLVAEPFAKPLVAQYVEPEWLAIGIAVGAVFIIVLVILKVLIAWIAAKVQRSALGGVDRALGLLFGLVRGAFIVVLAYIVGGLAVPAADRWPDAVRDARSLPLAADGARWLVGRLPEDFRPRLPDGTGTQDPSLDQLLRPPARSRT